MANDNVPDAVCIAQTKELRIIIERDVRAEFEGTAAQLTDEGLIPEGFEWPIGVVSRHWTASGYTYWLRRIRPTGHKGPMRSWLELDNWFVRIEVEGRDARWLVRRNLERQVEELEETIRRQTRAGLAETEARLRRYWAAQDDKAFQSFKALIPGVIPVKRARKSKSNAAVGE